MCFCSRSFICEMTIAKPIKVIRSMLGSLDAVEANTPFFGISDWKETTEHQHDLMCFLG